MSVMTIADAWPDAGQPFTVAELDRVPNDGRRYELLDGVLVVSPRPAVIHQFVAARLLQMLDASCPEGLSVIPEPAVQLGPRTEFDPDLVVIRTDQVHGMKVVEPPLLILEIRSPSTALIDLNKKKDAYERFGVPSYWIVDPDPDGTEFIIFERRDGKYLLAEKTTAPFTVSSPFPVSITPAELTRRLQRFLGVARRWVLHVHRKTHPALLPAEFTLTVCSTLLASWRQTPPGT